MEPPDPPQPVAPAPLPCADAVLEIVAADSDARIASAGELFREYAASLAIDLSFQHFDAEVAALPGDYAAPAGALLLAFIDGEPAGCGALRPLADTDYPDACEMKRLYVRPRYRGLGVGRVLAQALMDLATQTGYRTMLLDTLDEMESARGLYAALGFDEVPPYYYNPVAGAHYLKADLDSAPSRW